ncbi:576_t:CDS:1, partial [Cetraspora pellucida]
VLGGSVDKEESFDNCVKRKVQKEAKVELDKFEFIIFDKGFCFFSNKGKEFLYKTAIYFVITDEILEQKELDRNNE